MVSKAKLNKFIEEYLEENPFDDMKQAQAAAKLEFSPSIERKIEGRRDEMGRMYPNDIGKEILKQHKVVRDKNSICYEYNYRFWEELTLGVMQRYALLADDDWCSTSARRTETISYVTATAQLVGDICWGAIADNEVALWSGVFNFDKNTQRPHSADDWLETVIPWTWISDAQCPEWNSAMERWFKNDDQWAEKMSALQEFFGYCLLNHAKFKKALLLYGEPNTGKSVVMMVLTELVGKNNTCSISVEDMDDMRAVAPIRGKLLNVMSDLTSRSLIADGGFKRLVSTGDAIQIDAKWQRPELYIPTAKHAVATNILPKVDDKTWGTFERLLVIRFPNIIPKAEMDRELTQRLVDEMPGILKWAVDGARRLARNKGQFTIVPESELILSEYREEQNPVFAFVEEVLVEGTGVEFTEFFTKFREWYGKPVPRATLSRWVSAAGMTLTRRRAMNGSQKKYVDGYVLPY